MRRAARIALLALGLGVAGAPAFAQEVVAEVRVHGNAVTPDEEIVRAAGLSAGMSFSDALLVDAERRLREMHRFERVETLKRYASIADPTRIAVLILVDEGPVRIVVDPVTGRGPRVERRRLANVMYLPMVSTEDGYGLTYGARISVRGALGGQSLVSFPLTWGGDRRAAVELQRDLAGPLAPRLTGGAFVQRRTHPFFEAHADRTRVWTRAEWQLARPLRAGGTVGWQRLSLAGDTLTARTTGADLIVDTRLDPLLPRNAVYARAAVERIDLAGRSPTVTSLDARGYVGVFGQTVLVLRAQRESASALLPPVLQPILGGRATLRGFRAGTAVGDTLVAASAELRVPLTSPLSVGKFGVNAFVDIGAVYASGQRLRDQPMRRGVGGGLWMGATVFRFSLEVARGLGSGTRAHIGAGLGF